MKGLRQWFCTLAAVAAVLGVAAIAPAGQIYDISGTFAPSLVNQEATPFTGSLGFPGETVETGLLKLAIGDNPPLVREVAFTMSSNVQGDMFDTRTFTGMFEGKPLFMLSLDFDQEAGGTLASDALSQGGGWDSWGISFPDFPSGSISSMVAAPQVGEPAAMALLAVGGVLLMGALRAGVG